MTTIDTYVSRPYNALKVAALGFMGLAMSYLPGNAQAAPPGWACQEVPGKVREVIPFGDGQPIVPGTPYGIEFDSQLNTLLTVKDINLNTHSLYRMIGDGSISGIIGPTFPNFNGSVALGRNPQNNEQRIYYVNKDWLGGNFIRIIDYNTEVELANWAIPFEPSYDPERITGGAWDTRSHSLLLVDGLDIPATGNPILFQFDTFGDNLTEISRTTLSFANNLEGLTIRPYDGKLFAIDASNDLLYNADLQYDPNGVITGLTNVSSTGIIGLSVAQGGKPLDSPAGLAYNTDISQLVLVDQGAENGNAGELHIIDDGRLSATDFNNDGTVDMLDVTAFIDPQIFKGPSIPYTTPDHINYDVDGDGDVDLHDFAALQREFTGPCP
jgi:hypothetical protein